MRDVDDRRPAFIAQPLQDGQDLGLAGLIQRGQRLIHQQQARPCQQGAPDRDPLLLPAGQALRTALKQHLQPQQGDDLIDPHPTALVPREPAAIEQILAHAEMREQPRILKHIADAASLLWHKDADLGINQNLAIDGNAPLPGPDQSANRIDQAGLARAGSAKQSRQPRVRLQADIQPESTDVMAHLKVDQRAHCRTRR